MNVVDVMIIAATILGILFPSFLIKAIRSTDEGAASDNKVIACIIFGAIVFITLCIINS